MIGYLTDTLVVYLVYIYRVGILSLGHTVLANDIELNFSLRTTIYTIQNPWYCGISKYAAVYNEIFCYFYKFH